jgi:probable O-glycosylation ligase (exosortase A-associated)
MKQTLFMIVMTVVGTLGPFIVEPFVGVAIYYLFAVLRPQYMWQWALPLVGWSGFVAWSTIFATIWWMLSQDEKVARSRPRFSAAHKAYLLFGAWICLTYVTAQNREAAWPWFIEYIKLFFIFAVAARVLVTLNQVWWIYRLSAIALIYIAYEMNYLYLVNHRLDIYHYGYGGLDNNGAGLMLAMGVPLALYAWEGTTRIWRWAYLAAIPVLLHAVLMSYSRGAMLALLAVTPLLWLRSRRRWQFTGAFILVALTVPYLAGAEIRARFFSIQEYNTDASANARLSSWDAAFKIANDYPIFGVGIRNSTLMSYKYGADMEGRAIHSQYLQVLADSGYPGMVLYIVSLGSAWFAMARARRLLKKSMGTEVALARSMLNGVEGALFVFCFGASFLSMEVFELPYVVTLIGVQIAILLPAQAIATRREQPVPRVGARQPLPAFRAL